MVVDALPCDDTGCDCIVRVGHPMPACVETNVTFAPAELGTFGDPVRRDRHRAHDRGIARA
jgi:hypothetical protein